VHVAASASCTVRQAGELWIAAVGRAGRERTTVQQYRQHLDLHIAPTIGEVKLTALTPPSLRAFEERLRDTGRSPSMVRKLLVSLGSLLADAQERGLVVRNVVRDIRGRRGNADSRAEKRAKGKLRGGVDIPLPSEIKTLVARLSGKWRPILLTAIFTGLRSSELRGLSWRDVDLQKKVLHVRQRADRFNQIGRPKSGSGEREVPLTPIVVNTLREWKVACPRGDLELVFPTGEGKVENRGNIVNRGLIPAMIAAGLTHTGPNGTRLPKYAGMHALRHFYASWLINAKAAGGLELPAKEVQERMGHSSIVITMDTYGHLFPRGDVQTELATAERAFGT
jgi:integrase